VNKRAYRQTHINFWCLLMAVLALLFVQSLWQESSRGVTIPYSEFRSMRADGRLESISVTATKARGRLKDLPGAARADASRRQASHV
jgi:cell division protease FtsH